MFSNRKVREEINAINKELLSLETYYGKKSLDRRRGIFNSSSIADNRKERFLNSTLSVRYLQDGLAGNQLDSPLK